MKSGKRLLILFFLLSFVFGQNIDVKANPRMIFTNKETEMPDLYITKTVKSADTIPEDTEFTFEVKVDGIPYAKKEYEIYTEGSDTIQKEVTSQNGEIILKNNQKARFVYVGVGKTYEVTETSTINGYRQIIPAEGTSCIGTVTAKGATAEFTNEYIDPSTQTEYTDLKINKRILVPNGYQMENESFSFLLSIEGKPYADQEFGIYDLNTDQLIRNEKTDEQGGFILSGGQYALFSEVETGVDYEVKELEKGGWWNASGNTEVKGVTQSNLTSVEFNNSQTSFLVTKKMDDDTRPDETFTFQLTDENKLIWKDASYYLYSTKGELLNPEIQKTDEQGYFYLKAGESALFTGIRPGTGYNVKEIPLRGYAQTVPSSPDGYTEKQVNSSIEELPFINHEDQTKGLLMVTKKIRNAEDATPSETAEFTFSISRVTKTVDENDVESETVTPVKGASYEKTKGTEIEYNVTDENGYFKLKAGETAKFTSLRSGEYQIEEITEQMNRNYYTDESARIQRKTLKLSDENGTYFEFENVFQMHKLDLKIHKISNTDGSALSGAIFRLYKDQELKEEYVPEGEIVWNGYQSDENGSFTIAELPLGTYYLKEIKAPDGYGVSEKIHIIEIIRKGDAFYAVIDGIESSTKENAAVHLLQGETRYEDGGIILENDLAEYSLKNREKRSDCSIKITKYQNSSKKDPLKGVTFRLTDKDGLRIEKTSDEDGILEFNGLEEGEYELTEVKTASGFSLLTEPIKVKLPYSFSVEEVEDLKLDTSEAEFVSTKDAWFYYHAAYQISNTAVLYLPSTGKRNLVGMIGIGLVVWGICLQLYKRKKEA